MDHSLITSEVYNVHNIHCTLYTIYNVHCTLYTMYTVQCTQCTVYMHAFIKLLIALVLLTFLVS